MGEWPIVFMWNSSLFIYMLLVLQGSFWCFFRIGSLDLVMVGRCGCKVYKLQVGIRKRHQGEQEKNISLMGNC